MIFQESSLALAADQSLDRIGKAGSSLARQDAKLDLGQGQSPHRWSNMHGVIIPA